jgi:peptidoglycan/LPS O-acetylase OafA/YrhL
MDDRSRKLDGRMASLDLLRLVAALSVVGFHYLFRGAAPEPFLDAGYPAAAPFAIFGYLGVNLFFLISGFVIAWSAEGRTWRDFAIARFARLYPGYLACMSASFIVLAVARDPRLPADVSAYLANLLMFAPALHRPFMDGVYWSIVLEIVFYGWIALLLMTGLFRRHRLQVIAAWLLITAANEFVLKSGALRLALLTEYAPFFAGGMLAQHIVTRGRSVEAMVLAVAAFLLSCDTLTVTQGWMQAHYGVSLSLAQLLGANIVIHALFVGAVLLRRRIAPTGFILLLGGLTYPLYLLHQNIGYLALNALAPHLGRWPALALVTAAMLAAALFVCRFVEMPARKPLIRVLTGLFDGASRRLAPMPLQKSLRITRRQMAAE